MSEIKVNSVVNSTGDNDSGLDLATNDQVKVKIANAEDFIFKANSLEVQTGSNIDMNGTEFILDADADTSMTADTDDQIDFKVGGSDKLRITATALVPATDDAYDLGTSSLQFQNIYTGDLHLSNMSKDIGNIVDGSKGDWTIQEGSEDLFLINNNSGKKYKFNLTEV